MSRTSPATGSSSPRRWATPRNTGSGPDTTLTPQGPGHPPPRRPSLRAYPRPRSRLRHHPRHCHGNGRQASAVTAQVRRVADVAATIAPGMPRGPPSGHTVPRHTVRRPPNRQRDNALRGDAHPCQNSCAIAIMARAAAPGVRSDGAARENCHSRSASSTVSVATSSCPLGRATRGSSATPRPFRT